MSLLPLLPSEANNSVIPVLEPYSVSFFDTYFEVFWNQNALGDLIQPQLLRVHAYCCATTSESQPKLRYYLEYFTKDRHNRYRLVAQGHARISEIFYLEWQDRYVFYSGNNIVCPDYVSPWDTRISQLEFESTIDRWVSLSDLVIGMKQNFLPFQVDFKGCDPLPIKCKDGPGWYSQIIFNGDPLGDPVFLTIPKCVPAEGTEAAQTVFNQFVDFIIDSIIDLAPSLINASKTVNPFIGTIVSILFEVLQDAVEIDMQFCPCPPGTECVPNCGCLPPCPAGFRREGCGCVEDLPANDPPPDDIDRPGSPLAPPLRIIYSPKKRIPDGPNGWYFDFPEFPMNQEASDVLDPCRCTLYNVVSKVTFYNVSCNFDIEGAVPFPIPYTNESKSTFTTTFQIYGEFLEHSITGKGVDPKGPRGVMETSLARGFKFPSFDSGCGNLRWFQDGVAGGNDTIGGGDPSCSKGAPPTDPPRSLDSFIVSRVDGQSMEVCGWPKFDAAPNSNNNCLPGNWYMVIELISKRFLPLKGFRRIISVPGDSCNRPFIVVGEGGFYFVKSSNSEPNDKPLNLTLTTLFFYSPRLADAYFFQS